jgi:hypothetical protein
MKEYPIKKVLSLKYSFVTCFLFLSLFLVDAAIGGIKIEKQFSRSSINNHKVSTIKEIELVTGIIENRFVATGVIVDIKHTAEKLQRFVMLIKDIESIGDYANHGEAYLDKSVEILSEIGIPCSFRPGLEVSLVLRVSGDERGQYLFLVKVINDDKT